MGVGTHQLGANGGRTGSLPASDDRSIGAAPGSDAGDGWEALFWLVFNRSRSPIVLLDEQQRILEVNEPAAVLFRRARGESLGRSMTEWFGPDERVAAAREWPVLLRTGERVGSRVIVRPDGSSIEVEWAGRVANVAGRRVVIAVMLDANPILGAGHGAQLGALTPRERQVVTLIALGNDTAEIARTLVVSPETVKSHVRKAMSRLRAHTRAQLVAAALATGQIAPVSELDG